MHEGEQLPGGRKIAVRGCLAQLWRVKPLRVDEQREEGIACGGEQQNCEVTNWRVRAGFSSIVKSTVGGVCMWVRIDSPATPLPKAINFLNHQQSFLMKVVGIKQGKKTHGYFSLIG